MQCVGHACFSADDRSSECSPFRAIVTLLSCLSSTTMMVRLHHRQEREIEQEEAQTGEEEEEQERDGQGNGVQMALRRAS